MKLDYGVAKLDSLITNRITNEIRFQYGRELNNEGLQNSSAYTKANLINSTGCAPEVSLTTANGFFLGQPYYSFRPSYPDERKTQIGDTASFAFGKHTLRVGEDIVRNNDYHRTTTSRSNGFYTYSQGTTQNSQANYFADLLTHGKTCATTGTGVNSINGHPCYNSRAQGFGQSGFQFSTMDYGFFGQDDWKIRPTLTLNLGVRYDYVSLPPAFASVQPSASADGEPSERQEQYRPRIGFAWIHMVQARQLYVAASEYYGRIIVLGAESTVRPRPRAGDVYADDGGRLCRPKSARPLRSVPLSQFFPRTSRTYTEQFDLAVQQEPVSRMCCRSATSGLGARAAESAVNVNLDPTKTYKATYTVAAEPMEAAVLSLRSATHREHLRRHAMHELDLQHVPEHSAEYTIQLDHGVVLQHQLVL